MKKINKQYWKGLEQLTNDPEFVKNADKEFPSYLPIKDAYGDNSEGEEGTSRRDFLKLMGFSVAAASLASCETPIKKAIPYLNKPEEVDPGIPNYYASTYVLGGDYCGVLVKTREGRPIKIEGNKLCPITKGGVNAQVEASVLSLYDKERLTDPYHKGKKTKWDNIDKEVVGKLNHISNKGGKIAIVSRTIISPTTKKALGEFKLKYPTTEHIVYDPQSSYGIIEANAKDFGKAVIPTYRFDKAKVIVSFSADFLGTWLSPIAFTKQYSQTRKLGPDKKKMSKHFQFEANLSLTGANADYRIPIKPSEEPLAILALLELIEGKSVSGDIAKTPFLKKIAEALRANKGNSLVVSSSNDPDVQNIINSINNILGNYGKTISIDTPSYVRQGDDKKMNRFMANANQYDAVIFYNCNPLYDHSKGKELATALKNVELTLSTSDRMDETASVVEYVAPDHHYLESWNDAEPQKGILSLGQPAISPLFNTRQAQESFLKWSGSQQTDYYAYIKQNWKENYYAGVTDSITFQHFFDKCLHDGILIRKDSSNSTLDNYSTLDITQSKRQINSTYKKSEGIDLVLYQKIGIGTGEQANNPWLQELPDPITKACWDNYLTVSQSFANKYGLKMVEGKTRLANLVVNGQTYTLPILVQPGQAKDTIGLALGYGRKKAGRVADGRGVDAFPLVETKKGFQEYSISNVKIEVSDSPYQLAQTQTHETYMGRENVVQETILSEYQKDPSSGRYQPMIMLDGKKTKPKSITLWKGYEYNNHHWGLVIDMNSCTGCSACLVSCQAENNVPVVGKQEVVNRREMHWIRIDRYYSSDATPEDGIKAFEKAAENPEVTFQPMMCQHCNNAPCETVCPVLATTHSTEGLNQMTYNRCVGTRYCANNCPYKVRRFNWFKYHDNTRFPDNTTMNNDLGKMVLNPDVTVRARGVMEKCSMCIQRIQAGKLKAKSEGRRPSDEDINMACASACPADAIVFGDMNDPNSSISKLLKLKEEDGDKVVKEERAYHMLEELRVDPNVFYLTKVRNKDSNNV